MEKCTKAEGVSKQVAKNKISTNHPKYKFSKVTSRCQYTPVKITATSVTSLVDQLTTDNSHFYPDIFYLLRWHPGGVITQ